MKFISAKCSNIPIPKIIAHGLWGPGPLEGHPFMLIEELPGQSLRTIWDRAMASKALREKVFGQLAGIQIQLSRFRFKEIGSPLLKEHEALEVWGQRLANCLYVRFVHARSLPFSTIWNVAASTRASRPPRPSDVQGCTSKLSHNCISADCKTNRTVFMMRLMVIVNT